MTSASKSDFHPSMLVADDDKAARDILCLMIRMKFPDHPVYPAEDGSVGVEVFREHLPEIVITDVNMPVKNGIEMAAEIRALKPDTRFIVLTAYSEKVFLDQFNAIGFDAYILKPVEFRKLYSEIEKCIRNLPEKHQ